MNNKLFCVVLELENVLMGGVRSNLEPSLAVIM